MWLPPRWKCRHPSGPQNENPRTATASDVTDGERDLLALAQSCLHRKGEVEDMLDRQWLTETTPLDVLYAVGFEAKNLYRVA